MGETETGLLSRWLTRVAATAGFRIRGSAATECWWHAYHPRSATVTGRLPGFLPSRGNRQPPEWEGAGGYSAVRAGAGLDFRPTLLTAMIA